MSVVEYEKWRRSNGVGVAGGVGVKRKMYKVPKGMFTAAGKHPIGALKEKIPTCEFAEVIPNEFIMLSFFSLNELFL